MKQLLFILMTALSISIQAQYFFGGTYQPKPCSENDSISILDTLSMETLWLDTRTVSFEHKGDSIFIHVLVTHTCASIGGAKGWYENPIGKLPKGSYTVIIDGSYRKDSACYTNTDTFFNKLSFKMEVLAAPNSIAEQTLSPTYLQSTLIQNELILQALPAKSSILVYDMQGRQCYRKENESGEAAIDASGWSSGIYIVSVQAENERRRWRIVKE